MMNYDLTSVLENAPVGQWIALSHNHDRIVATAPLMEDAIAAAQAKGEENPVMMKVPPAGALIL
ncbi:MAG: DUF5678 domain-containing protein [Acidobacteriota bacterium]